MAVRVDISGLVTNTGHMRTINASELKARLLAVLDEVRETGEPVLVLKRGKPVARLEPPAGGKERYPQDLARGCVQVVGDVIGPVLDADAWEAEAGS